MNSKITQNRFRDFAACGEKALVIVAGLGFKMHRKGDESAAASICIWPLFHRTDGPPSGATRMAQPVLPRNTERSS